MSPLDKFKNDLALMAHGITKDEAIALHICICCKEPPDLKTNEESLEYLISGLCNTCFDSITQTEEPE